MNAVNSIDIPRLAERLIARLTLEIEASGRHIHLSRADVEALFGTGYQLNRVKDLSQPDVYKRQVSGTQPAQRGGLSGSQAQNPSPYRSRPGGCAV